MTPTPRLFLIAFAGAAAAASYVPTAEAGRVVVLAVQGDPEGEIEDGLISIVEERHDLVTSGEFERAARKSGIDDLDGPAIGKIARKLGADAVIEGSMSREDEGFLLVVRVRGNDGKTVKKISVDLNKPRLSAKAKKRLGTGVLDGIDNVLGLAGDERIDGDDEEEDDEDRASKKKSKKSKSKAKRDDDDDEDEDDEGDDDEGERDDDEGEDDDRVSSRDDDDDDDDDLGVRRGNDDDDDDGVARDRRHAAILLEVGPSAKARTLAFTSRPDFMQAPSGYKSPLVPGMRVAAEAYPLAFKDKGGKSSVASGLGVAGEFDQTLRLISRSSDAKDIELPTLQRNWEVGARFRYNIGEKLTNPTIVLGMGYGRRAFIVDRSGLPEDAKLDMPDVDYRFYAPSLAVRVPVGSRAAIHATGRALLFKSAGSIQRETSYGGAKVTGFDAMAGIEIRVAKQIVVDVSGSMTQIGFVFTGNGEEANNRDLDPSSIDVGGASDRYLGVVGSLGWAY